MSRILARKVCGMRRRYPWVVALWLMPATLLAADEGWRATMLDQDEPAIDTAHQRAAAVLEQLDDDAYGREDLPKARELLAARSLKRGADALVGNWRCRSTQIDRGGVFRYPAFRCTIEISANGTLQFTKRSGSQRRQGQIFPYTDASWVFIGGHSVNDDPYRTYSATLASPDVEDREHDSVGLLETLADGRVRLILDAQDERVEFYELSR
jgi:hypothetical protein